MAETGFSALVVPVPELDWVLRPRVARLEPGQVVVDPDVLLAHITLLAPFARPDALTPGAVGQLAEFFGDVVPFRFALTEVCRFPGGGVYLAPDPSAPFRQLTHELWRRFPEHPPFEGRFDGVVPHLSVPLPPPETLVSLERQLAPRLPVTAHAREAWLVWAEPGASRLLETFPFGVAAA